MKSAKKTKLKKLIVAVATSEARIDRRAADVAQPGRQMTALGRLGRRLVRRDPASEKRRDEERERVGDERDRRGEQLDERGRRGSGPTDERERAAAVQERVRLDVALARHERDEQRAVGDVEEHAERARSGSRPRTAARSSARRARRRSGSLTSSAARPRSVASITCRRRPRRSTHAPACSEKSRFGSSAAVRGSPSPPASRAATRTPTSGSAISETWSPTSETACPAKNVRNAGFSRSSGGTRITRATHRDVAAHRRAPELDQRPVRGDLDAADLELGRRVAAHRAGVDVEPRAA